MLIVYGVLIAAGSVAAAATGGMFCFTLYIIESMENENEDEEEEEE